MGVQSSSWTSGCVACISQAVFVRYEGGGS